MSHFAEISGSTVIRVIVAEQGFINSGAVGNSSNWIQTSYNNNFRKQYAGIGYTYDSVNDVFIKTQPFPSWSLNETFDWQSPTPLTEGLDPYLYTWDEDTLSWVLL